MQPYILLLGVACVVNAVCAGMIASRETSRPESRATALLHLGAAWWGFCEIAWNLAPDASTALMWIRASGPGWIFVGPLVLHAFSHLGRGAAALRRTLPIFYAAGAVFLVLTWTSSTVIAEAVSVSWGWGYAVGGVYGLFCLFTFVAVGAGYAALPRVLHQNAWTADRRQLPILIAAMAIPLGVASTTDAILPLAGIQVPRLGTSALAALGVLTVVNLLRFGYSLVVPASFSDGILATLGEGVALLQPDGTIRTANDGLADLTGRVREELEGMRLDEILTRDSDEPLREAQEGRGRVHATSGGGVPVAVSSRTMRDRRGNPLGLVVSMRDLREVESLRSRLVTSDRLAAVGQLAAGIAHEINNPLAFVRANLSLLEEHWKRIREPLRGNGDDISADQLREILFDADELIEESLEGVDRAAEIVRGVRNFSHAGSGSREPAAIDDLMEQVLVMASPRLKHRVEIERSYASLPTVRCAPQQLKQVFLNLIVNAEQAMDEGGTLRLTTRHDGDFVEVEVQDDGHGIPEEILDRIFDPFFTTKPVGEGQGLGLGIAHEIVRSHRGSIQVDSLPGHGTRFTVRLPVDPGD